VRTRGLIDPSDAIRLTHRCHIFQMNGESYRFRESAGTKKDRRKPTKPNGPAAEPATK